MSSITLVLDLRLPLLNLRPKRILNVIGPPGLNIRIEHHIDLLQRPACSLGVHEEHMDGHREAEYSEDDVCPPLDVVEGRGYKVG